MLDIYIKESDEEAFCRIKDICFRYLMRKNYEAEVYRYSEECLSEQAALFILSFCGDTETLSRKIRGANSGSYIVVSAGSLGELKKAVTPGICPSGCLVKPYEAAELERVLDEIYADRIRCCADAHKLGIFSFRQKAKEYAVPYEKIILFESRNKKVIVRTEVQEYEFYTTLDAVLKDAPDCFMKIHKSFVVNLSRIVSADYGDMSVEFDDGSEAYISRTYKNELKERLSRRSEAYDVLSH